MGILLIAFALFSFALLAGSGKERRFVETDDDYEGPYEFDLPAESVPKQPTPKPKHQNGKLRR